MMLEIANLVIRENQQAAFEDAFRLAQEIITQQKGYLFHELHQCVENPQKYALFVQWETLEDHTIGFRKSAAYQEWKQQMHAFFEPTTFVEHYQKVAS